MTPTSHKVSILRKTDKFCAFRVSAELQFELFAASSNRRYLNYTAEYNCLFKIKKLSCAFGTAKPQFISAIYSLEENSKFAQFSQNQFKWKREAISDSLSCHV